MVKHSQLLAMVDHTLLKPEASWQQVQDLIDDAIRFQTASVCISPCYVAQAREYAAGKMPICTVIGFPSGAHTSIVKEMEARDAVKNGADELDMVINIGMLKAGNDRYVLDEIRRIKEAAEGRIVKVIIETCLLTEAEKIRMCEIVTHAEADFIKTSTGFSTGGATFEDIALFAAHIGPDVRIKAAGGISSFEDAREFIRLGASRLGTSRLVKLAKAEDAGKR